MQDDKFVQSRFMESDNLFEVVVRYLIIEDMTYLGHRDEFSMVSALVCMVTY